MFWLLVEPGPLTREYESHLTPLQRMIDVVSTVCTRARDAYVAVADDAPPTLVASLTSFVWSLRLTDLFGGGFSLPPPPAAAPHAALSVEAGENAGAGDDGGTEASATASAGANADQAGENSGPTAEEKGKGKQTEAVPAKAANDPATTPSLGQTEAETLAANNSSSLSVGDVDQHQFVEASSSTRHADGPDVPATSPPLNSPAPPAQLASTPSSPTPASPPRPASDPAGPSRASSSRAVRRPEEAPYVDLPPAMVVLLLPFHELLDSNKTFCSLVYNDRPQGGGTYQCDRDFPAEALSRANSRNFSLGTESPANPTLPVELISLASYMVCHATLSHRARTYSRLAFVILMILVEEGEGKLTQPRAGGEEIRICRQVRRERERERSERSEVVSRRLFRSLMRAFSSPPALQRQPTLPQRDSSRSIPLSALIDTVVLFLRHNLRKRLEVETYT